MLSKGTTSVDPRVIQSIVALSQINTVCAGVIMITHFVHQLIKTADAWLKTVALPLLVSRLVLMEY